MSYPRAKSSAVSEDLEIEIQALQFQVADLIAETMAEQDVTKAELARRLGVSSAHVTQMLSGERNLTLKSVTEALYVLDRRLETSTVPLRAEPQPMAQPDPHRIDAEYEMVREITARVGSSWTRMASAASEGRAVYVSRDPRAVVPRANG